jgi:hypothetical protein
MNTETVKWLLIWAGFFFIAFLVLFTDAEGKIKKLKRKKREVQPISEIEISDKSFMPKKEKKQKLSRRISLSDLLKIMAITALLLYSINEGMIIYKKIFPSPEYESYRRIRRAY